jgi:hypothetical protein
MDNSGGVWERGGSPPVPQKSLSRARAGRWPCTGKACGRGTSIAPLASRRSERRNGGGESFWRGAAPNVAQPVEVPRAWPPWGFEQRREAVWRARERAEDALDILCMRGVPMPLTKRRLESACEGVGLSIAVYTAVRRTNCPSGSRSVLTHKGLPRRTCNRCATGKDADRIRLLPH